MSRRAYDVSKLVGVTAAVLEYLDTIQPDPDASELPELRTKLASAMQNLHSDLSPLERDGIPTVYLSQNGYAGTHRQSEDDIRVWCADSLDGMRLMNLFDWLVNGKPRLRPKVPVPTVPASALKTKLRTSVGPSDLELAFDQFARDNGYVKASTFKSIEPGAAHQAFFNAASADGGYDPRLGVDAVVELVKGSIQ